MLRFEEVRTKRKGDVPWTRAKGVFPAVRFARDAFGKRGPDEPLFYAALRTTVGAGAKITGFYSAASARLRVFVYFANQEMAAVEVEMSAALKKWLTTMAEPYVDGKRGLEFDVADKRRSIGGLREESAELLESNPLKLLISRVPSSFKAGGEQSKKAAYLAKLVAARKPAPKANAASVERAVAAFLDARKHKKAPPKNIDARLAAFETRLGEKLPLGLLALYRRADGGKGLFFAHDSLSLKELEEQWALWRGIYDEWTLSDLTGHTAAQRGVTQGLYCCPRWIPFIDLEGGNHVAVDLLPGPKGSVGQVIVFGRDIQTIRCIAPDVESFLEQCAAFDGKKGPLADVFTSLVL